MTKLIYTVLAGPVDNLKEPKVITPGWEYKVYTDQEVSPTSAWTKVSIEFQDTKMASRYYKTNPPPGYDVTVYIDGIYRPLGNLDEFVKNLPEGVSMTVHPHNRDCVYEEAEFVRMKRLDNSKALEDQLARYKAVGYPEHNGLYRCGVVVRKGSTKAFDDAWWNEITIGSWRDQVGCPYAAWVTGTPINKIPYGQVERFFRPYLHLPRPMSNVIVHTDKHNVHPIEKNKWVCLGDFPNPEEAIAKYPSCHLMVSGDAKLFPRWLYDYIQFTDQMLYYVKLYRGTVVYWNN